VPETLTGKIFREHLAASGDPAFLHFDHLLLHDATGSLLIDRYQQLRRSVIRQDRILAAADHFVPPATAERAEILQKYLEFLEELPGIKNRCYQGICHQVLVEEPSTGPGQLIIGADSHTVTAGAMGSLATGFGSTDILFAMLSGCIWAPKPLVGRLDLTGRIGPWIRGKDAALELLRRMDLSLGSTADLAWECFDRTDSGLSMDSRLALCSMAAEMNAAYFTLVPDATTLDFLRAKGNTSRPIWPDDGAEYQLRLQVAMPRKSLVSEPPVPWAVTEADSLGRLPVDQVFIGSCTGGRLEDLADAAAMLQGRQVAKRVRLVVIPASRQVYRQAMAKGYIQALVEAGGMIGTPSCGPCGGIDKGVIGAKQRMVATSNRNYPGRTGRGECFLASAPTAAASAVAGRICDPLEVVS